MTYMVERLMSVCAERLWERLADLTHIAQDDPYHDQFEWIGEVREGVGTRFRVHHHYAPILPFWPDVVDCEVIEWIPFRRQIILEKNERAYRSHKQHFEIEPIDTASCKLIYRVEYTGVPRWLYPWFAYVNVLVRRRMRCKCRELEQNVLGQGFDKQWF